MPRFIKRADLVEAKKIPAKRRAANAAAVKEMLLNLDLAEVGKAAGVAQAEPGRRGLRWSRRPCRPWPAEK